ncbi:protein VAPYRIN-LIKE-like [Impatiens glandulifera]|uniref:protein VAPYRIN-LIKE-like n=1 Tax=Impatiens glandulifera TaxID=253017 RepID=UPI001FB0A74B|nr:protein VAPYRIN-LIKE-like [Impatiens glandulifera]
MDRLVKPDVKEITLNFTRGRRTSATFRLTNLMHTMSVAISLSTTNPSFSFTHHSCSLIPPLSTAPFTLQISQLSDEPPLSTPPDSVFVRSAMLPTGKATQEDLRRLFSKPGPHVFKDATISISLVGPHVVESLLSPPYKTLEIAFLLSKAISGCDGSDLSSLLQSAARKGNSTFVSALIDAGADVNRRDSDGQSAMSLAVQSGKIDCVKILIDSGNYVIDHSSDRFLHDAAVNSDRVDLIELLLSRFPDTDLNSVDSKGRTPLHAAAIHGRVDIIKTLISHGADTDAMDGKGWTPLHCTAAEGHTEAAKILINNSWISKHAITSDGKTAFALAIESGHITLYNTLHLGDELQRAARLEDIHSMKSCLVEGVDVNGRDQNGWTALHRAAFKGRMESVKLLIEHGAEVNAVDDGGRTALELAMETGHVQIAMRLMDYGARANMKKTMMIEKAEVDEMKKKHHMEKIVMQC